MSKRALILVLSVAVIGIAVAGLQGILNLLVAKGPLENPDGQSQIVARINPNSTKVISAPASPIITGQPTQFIFHIDKTERSVAAFPSLDISSQGALAAHVPLFSLSGNPGSPYLRSTVTSIYQNNHWKFDDSQRVNQYNGEKLNYAIENYARKSLTSCKIKPLSSFASFKMPIPAVQYVNRLTSGFPVVYDPSKSVFISEKGLPAAYSFDAIKYSFDNETLNNAKVAPGNQYLEIPQGIPGRITNLAKEITNNIDSPYLRAKSIEEYLKTNYVYDLDYRAAPGNWEPNDWFLFEERRGVCNNFNSAFVILARASAIPARLVGGYYVDPQSESQIVYADQAHAWSEINLDRLGWITMDATGTNMAASIVTTTEIAEFDPVIDKNKPFTMEGTVKAENTNVNGVLVGIYLNQNQSLQNHSLIGQAIVLDNAFRIKAKIPESVSVGTYQLTAVSAQTPRFAASDDGLRIKVMSQTGLSISCFPEIKTGESISVFGRLIETSGQPLSGQMVNIMMNDRLLTAIATDSKGNFEYQSVIDESGKYEIKAQYAGSEYYYPCEQTISFQVLIPTNLTIQYPHKLAVGETLKIEGLLNKHQDKQPLANQVIGLFVDGEKTGSTAKTDALGRYVIEYKVNNPGISQIDVRYTGQTYFAAANAKGVIEISSSNDKTFIGLLLMLSGVLIAGGYLSYRLYCKYKRPDHLKPHHQNNTALSAISPVPAELHQPVWKQNEDTQNNGLKLEIEFPGIIQPLPDVWGLDDEFDVICQLQDAGGQPLPNRKIEISLGSPIASLITDDTGKAGVTLAFSEKGSFDIEASVSSPNDVESVTHVLRTIRIIDYREEIIDEYKALLSWFKQKEVPILSDNTTRETEQLIVKSSLPVSLEALETVLACFEEVTYSLHPITRQHYVKMHLAQEEIKQYEVQPEQIPQ